MGWTQQRQQRSERELKDTIDRLERQVEQQRQDQERQAEEARHAREERRREREREVEERQRTAGSWPEALRKQAHLLQREAAQFPELNKEDDWFVVGANACNRGLELWQQVEKENLEQYAVLQARLTALRDSVRIKVAELLEQECDRPGWREVARALREDDPEDWLQW